MSGFEKHPILANGEYYITPLEKRIGGGRVHMNTLRPNSGCFRILILFKQKLKKKRKYL